MGGTTSLVALGRVLETCTNIAMAKPAPHY